jgi:hypothetical protein
LVGVFHYAGGCHNGINKDRAVGQFLEFQVSDPTTHFLQRDGKLGEPLVAALFQTPAEGGNESDGECGTCQRHRPKAASAIRSTAAGRIEDGLGNPAQQGHVTADPHLHVPRADLRAAEGGDVGAGSASLPAASRS